MTMLTSLILIILVSLALVISGIKKVPGIGIIAALIAIGGMMWWRGEGLASLGIFPPASWPLTIGGALFLGIILQLASVIWIEPFCDRVTKSSTDHSIFKDLRGNFKNLLIWLISVWILVAFLEELVYRGFLISETAKVFGNSSLALAVNLLLSSLVFGLSHWYQGKSGALSTGLVGALLGLMFILTGFNLWLPIFAHGFIDTIGLTLIYLSWDEKLKKRLSPNQSE